MSLWKLVRQAADGKGFDVAPFASEAEAVAAMEEFERSYPRLQSYYVEQDASSDPLAALQNARQTVEASLRAPAPERTARVVSPSRNGGYDITWHVQSDVSRPDFSDIFARIRDEFLMRLWAISSAVDMVDFFACDQEGQPMPWVWNDESFGVDGDVGTLVDAAGFAGNMINQGMYFSVMITAPVGGTPEIWLSTYEYHDHPVWPADKAVALEVNHLGVRQVAAPPGAS